MSKVISEVIRPFEKMDNEGLNRKQIRNSNKTAKKPIEPKNNPEFDKKLKKLHQENLEDFQ